MSAKIGGKTEVITTINAITMAVKYICKWFLICKKRVEKDQTPQSSDAEKGNSMLEDKTWSWNVKFMSLNNITQPVRPHAVSRYWADKLHWHAGAIYHQEWGTWLQRFGFCKCPKSATVWCLIRRAHWTPGRKLSPFRKITTLYFNLQL